MSHDFLPPQDLISEMVVLGHCLVSPKRAAELLTEAEPKDFYRTENATVARAIAWCINNGKVPDPTQVETRIRTLGCWPEQGILIPIYLQECIDRVDPLQRAKDYAETVREMSVRRTIISAAEHMIAKVDQDLPLADVVNYCRGALQKACARDQSGVASMRIDAAVSEWFDTLEARSEADPEKRNALEGIIPTRVCALDHYLRGGVRRGQLVVIAARSYHGKSTLAMQCVAGAASTGHETAVFSLEMNRHDLMQKLAGCHFEIPASDLDGDISRETFAILGPAVGEMQRWPIEILVPEHGEGRLTVERIGARISELRRKPELVVIDNLNLLDIQKDRNETDAHAIGRATRYLKLLAMEKNICIVLLAQLNRETDKRENKRPTTADLRDSSSIEADADVIVLLSITGNYAGAESGDRTRPEKALMIVAKQRMGKTGDVPGICWHPVLVKWICAARGEMN